MLWIQQVVDRRQAEAAVAAGVDVIVAQGGEAGGNGGWVSTTALVREVVDLAGDVPVVAAGGIADGRGLAAALALGAQGVSMDEASLASEEATIADAWKRRIVAADALDAVKIVNAERILPPFTRPGGPVEPRALRTPLIDRLREAPDGLDAAAVGADLREALKDGGGHDLIPFTGQSAALVHDGVLPAGEIVHRVVAEAEAAWSVAPCGS